MGSRQHPAKRLAFLIDLSNRMETQDREVCARLQLEVQSLKMSMPFLHLVSAFVRS